MDRHLTACTWGLCALLSGLVLAWAANNTTVLEWNRPPPASTHDRYLLGYGISSNAGDPHFVYNWHQVLAQGEHQTALVLPNVQPGDVYYFAVASRDSVSGQHSGWGNEVSITIPQLGSGLNLLPPSGLRIVYTVTL